MTYRKGHIPWNKGKEHKVVRGENNPAKRPEVRVKLRLFNLNKKLSKETKRKIGLASKERKHTEDTKRKISINEKKHLPRTAFKKGHGIGKKNINWNNGSSFEPYGIEFNAKLKEQIRKRDKYRCQECFRHQSELREKLSIHHIDFNKKHNNQNNLISLCRNCHLQTNWNREKWTNYFQERLRGKT